MTINIIKVNSAQKDWNAVAPHPMQSWQWGEARKLHGVGVVRIAVEDSSVITQVFQITFHKIPHTPYTIGYLPRSIIFNKEVLAAIQKVAIENRSIFVKFEPYETNSDENRDKVDELLSTRIVRKSPHGLFPNWTQMINLEKTKSQLLELCKPKTRYNIKLAQKKGVVVVEDTTERGFNIFASLYFETCKRQGYHGHTKQYHRILFETLNPSVAHILIASYNNIPLGAYELFLFNNTLYYPYGGSSQQHRNLMASNVLMWEAICFGVTNKAKMFDMWGSLPPSTTQDSNGWAGFSRFKEGFGSEYVEFVGSYDIILDPGLYHLYNAAYTVRKMVLKVL